MTLIPQPSSLSLHPSAFSSISRILCPLSILADREDVDVELNNSLHIRAAADRVDSPAVRTFIAWVDSALPHGRAISYLTDGPWSHQLIGFELVDGSPVYYESLYKTGFTGPHDLAKLTAWLAKNPARKFVKTFVPIDAAASQAKRLAADRMAGNMGVGHQAGYGKLQLLLMAAFERYGIPVPASPNHVVCSEAVSRLLCPEIDLRDHRRKSHDEVNPNSAWHRWLEIQAGHGAITAPAQPPA